MANEDGKQNKGVVPDKETVLCVLSQCCLLSWEVVIKDDLRIRSTSRRGLRPQYNLRNDEFGSSLELWWDVPYLAPFACQAFLRNFKVALSHQLCLPRSGLVRNITLHYPRAIHYGIIFAEVIRVASR